MNERHLCLAIVGPTNGDRCLELIERVEGSANHQWRCGAGHIWYGRNPNVLKLTPWQQPSRRVRARRWFERNVLSHLRGTW